VPLTGVLADLGYVGWDEQVITGTAANLRGTGEAYPSEEVASRSVSEVAGRSG
jgi:hypothetical protein